MAKKNKFLDFFKVNDEENDDDFDDDDDIFDDDDEEYEEEKPKKKQADSAGREKAYSRSVLGDAHRTSPSTKNYSSDRTSSSTGSTRTKSAASGTGSYRSSARQTGTTSSGDKLVSFDREREIQENRRAASFRPTSEVYVIKPQQFNDAQTVADFLKQNKAIVINMEGLQLENAQRIIDFIGGACYGLQGELKAISANIFIAVPNSIEVSGDLRDEILSNSAVSPNLSE